MNERIYIVINQSTTDGFHSVDLKAYYEYADALKHAQDLIDLAMEDWSNVGEVTNLDDLDDDNPPLGAVVDLSGKDEGSFYIYENGNADMNEQCIYIKATNVL